jgi:hypothetical protein
MPVKDGVGFSQADTVLTEPVKVDNGEYVLSNTGMAGVVPVTKLIELLHTEEAIMSRKIDERELAEHLKNSSVTLDDAQPLRQQKTSLGHEIPIPTEEQVMNDLGKISRKKE